MIDEPCRGGGLARARGDDGLCNPLPTHPRTPPAGGLTGEPAEDSSEMSLIGHAAGQRDLTQRFVRGQHENLSKLDAFNSYIHMRCDTEARPECTVEPAAADAGDP